MIFLLGVLCGAVLFLAAVLLSTKWGIILSGLVMARLLKRYSGPESGDMWLLARTFTAIGKATQAGAFSLEQRTALRNLLADPLKAEGR